MVKLFANNEDPDQMPHSVASDLGLHYLLITLLGVSRLQWVKWQLLSEGKNRKIEVESLSDWMILSESL